MKKHLEKLSAALKKHQELTAAPDKISKALADKSNRLEALKISGTDDDTSEIMALQTEVDLLPRRIENAKVEAKESRSRLAAIGSNALAALVPFINLQEVQLKEKAIAAVRPFCEFNDEAIAAVERLSKVRDANHLERDIDDELSSLDPVPAVENILELLKAAIASEAAAQPNPTT